MTVGGPIVLPHIYNGRNKTFFFYSFEDTKGSAIQQLINPTVPLASWRAGNFSALAPATVVKDPFNGGAPFPDNIIPTSRINPIAVRIQDAFWPLPNYGNTSVLQSQNFRQNLTRPYDPSTFTNLRLDHRFSEKFTVFARYNWARSYGRPYDGNLPGNIGQAYGRRQNDGAGISATYVFRSNLLNEFRWGLGYNDNNRWPAPNGLEFDRMLGLTGLAPNIPANINGVPKINFSGLGLTSVTVSNDYRNPGFGNRVNEFQDHISWFRGRHSVKVGADLPRVGFMILQAPTDLFGSLTFSNTFTGFTYGDFLLGIPATTSRSYAPLETQLLRWGYEFYVTDDFKVSRTLTLNLGLRYELHPLYHQQGDLLSVFDIAHGAIVVPDSALSKVSPLLPSNYVKVIGADAAGLPQKLVNTDTNNFAPRFGLAWRPWGNTTVLRAGFGIFFDHVPYAVGAAGIPFLIQQPAFTNPANNPTVILPQIYPSTTAGPSTLSLPSAVNPNLATPYSMQYNVTIEHQHWGNGFRLSFIAANTRKGEYTLNYNQPIPNNQPYISKPRPFPNFPAINYYTNGAGHQYNSGEFEVRRALAKGLTYDFSYVLARDIADLERKSVARGCVQPAARAFGVARHSHPSHHQQHGLRASLRKRQAAVHQCQPRAQRLHRRMVFDGHLYAALGELPHAGVDRTRSHGHHFHRQLHSGAGNHPSQLHRRSQCSLGPADRQSVVQPRGLRRTYRRRLRQLCQGNNQRSGDQPGERRHGKGFSPGRADKTPCGVARGERLQSSQLVGTGAEHYFGIPGRRDHRCGRRESLRCAGHAFSALRRACRVAKSEASRHLQTR